MKPRGSIIRYATRRLDRRKAERPPYRAPDPLVNNPDAVVQPLRDKNVTFIYRPPPTLPTPFSLTTSPSSPFLRPSPSANDHDPPSALPPLIRPSADKPPPPPASDATIAEIQRLRLSDPSTYSRGKLAKMFGCTEAFVGMIAALPKPKRKAMVRVREEGHAKMRERWSEKKSVERAVKAKRREFW